MRKLLFIILVLSVFFISCDDKDMNDNINPFVGTWEGEIGNTLYTFTETYIICKYADTEDTFFSGSYAYNETHITITTDYRDEVIISMPSYPYPLVWSYSFKNNIFLLAGIVMKKIN